MVRKEEKIVKEKQRTVPGSPVIWENRFSSCGRHKAAFSNGFFIPSAPRGYEEDDTYLSVELQDGTLARGKKVEWK